MSIILSKQKYHGLHGRPYAWLALADALRTDSIEFDKDKLNLVRELLA